MGFTPSNAVCMSCATAMTDCLECSSVSVCTRCREGYFYDSNNRRCSACGSSMPDCQLCDLKNNCLQCEAGFYQQAFNKCQKCHYSVAQCCPNFVSNCLTCRSQVACEACQLGYFLNNQTTACSPCAGLFDEHCSACTSSSCLECATGYYLSVGGCVLCNSTIPNCFACPNSTTCAQCISPYTFQEYRCVNCPVWPTNNLYYLDGSNTCQSCRGITHNCRSCSGPDTCTECLPLYYLQSGACLICVGLIDNCLACRDGRCRQCYEGYYLQSGACVTCGSQLSNCVTCADKDDNSGIGCTQCYEGYKLANGLCVTCMSAFSHCLKCTSFGCLTCE